jgi:hypothetical protein
MSMPPGYFSITVDLEAEVLMQRYVHIRIGISMLINGAHVGVGDDANSPCNIRLGKKANPGPNTRRIDNALGIIDTRIARTDTELEVINRYAGITDALQASVGASIG